MNKAKILALSFLWLVLYSSQVPAAGLGEALFSPDYPERFSYHPYPFSFSDEAVSPLSTNLGGLQLTPLQIYFSHPPNEMSTAIQGIKARYEVGRGNYRIEISGGYVPGMKSLAHSETQVDPKAYLGFVNFRIPLFQFRLKGGAFFGQSSEAFDFVFDRPSDEPNMDRGLSGYQIGGEYRFSDFLSIQAGWGQAAQAYQTAREDLRTLYLQAHISLGWRMSITPHVGFVDFTKEDGVKVREEAFYCGARWQINF